MSTLLINEEFLTHVNNITDKILHAKNRWNNDQIFSQLYNTTIFKLILIDYYYINKFKKLFLDLEIDIITILSLDEELLNRVNSNLDYNIRKYIKNIFDENPEVEINLESVITHYLETRGILSRFLFTHIKESEFKVKRQIITQIKNWLETINTTYFDFFFNIKLPDIPSQEENHNFKVIYSQDMYKTFKNSLDQIKNSSKKVLSVTSYINYVPIALWFEGFEMTVVSNNVHQLRHLHFSIEQFNDLITEYHFNPTDSVKNLLQFNILFDNILQLNRFGELEYNSYNGILCNFVLSHYFNVTSNSNEKYNEKDIIKIYFKKLKQISTPNALILMQEESKYQDLIESIFKKLEFSVLLKVSTFEGFDRINWPLKRQ